MSLFDESDNIPPSSTETIPENSSSPSPLTTINNNNLVVEGVEENVNSRFIDYSIATPWEDFIASIERVLRSWKSYVHPSPAKKSQDLSHSTTTTTSTINPLNLPSFSVEIDYNGTKMLLQLTLGSTVYSYDSDTPKQRSRFNGLIPNQRNKMYHYFYHNDIPLWFTVRKYVLLTRYNGSILGDSERRLMFSALMAALDGSQVQVPVFISASPTSSLSKTLEVIGYWIISPRKGEMALPYQTSLLSKGSQVVHFESQILSNVGSKHPFFYVDGLMRLFGTKLWKFSRGHISISDEATRIIISAVEFYEFRYMNTPLSRVAQNSSNFEESNKRSNLVEGSISDQPVQLQLSSATKSIIDDLLVCYPTHPNNQDSGSNIIRSESQEYSQASHIKALALINSAQQQTKNQEEVMDTMLSEFGFVAPSYNNNNNNNASSNSGKNIDPTLLVQAYLQQPGGRGSQQQQQDFQVPLEKVLIQVHYQDMKQGSVVDNDYYTTLLPSTLPPSAWGAKAVFANTTQRGTDRLLDILSPLTVIPLYATSLRRLLALFICGKSARSGSTFRTITDSIETYGNLQGCISTDRAIDISSVLSLESRRAVVFLCATATQNKEAADSGGRGRSRSNSFHNSNNVQQELLMRVFSRSLWIDNDENGMDNKSLRDPFSWQWLHHRGGSENAKKLSFSSAPVGSWLSVVSVYLSSLDSITSMISFWQECLDEVRVHWENRIPIPRLSPPVPIIKQPESKLSTSTSSMSDVGELEKTDSVELISEPPEGVWMDPLWRDVVKKYSKTATPFELPDVEQNLPYQKLQMINMCIIAGDAATASTIDENEVEITVTKARQHLIAYIEKLQLELQEGSSSEVDERSAVSNASNDSEVYIKNKERDEYKEIKNSTLKKLVGMNISFRDISHINTPRFQRRLPMTSDSLAQHKHLANKLRQGSSRSVNENSMLRWQISYPELVSDLRAFKACNHTITSDSDSSDKWSGPDKPVSFEDFLVWYGGAGIPLPSLLSQEKENNDKLETQDRNIRNFDGITLEDLKSLWDESDSGGLSGPEQRPLFKAEQEAEKALGYLEGLTISQVAKTFLSSVLPTMHILLTYDVQKCYQQLLNRALQSPVVQKDLDENSNSYTTIFDPGQELQQDLNKINKLIRTALLDLALDTPLMGTTGGTGNKEEAVNQQALLSLDAVCTAVAQLEILLMKIEASAATFEYHPRLVGHIAKYGYVTATTDLEAKIILSLAKCASFGQDSHSWHSFDGRELGVPKKKIFDIRCQSKNTLLNAYSKVNAEVNVSPDKGVNKSIGGSGDNCYNSNCEEESWANRDYYSASKGNDKESVERNDDSAYHQMIAVLEDGSLRVAFRLQEDDT